MDKRRRGRKKPYSVIGISRKRCVRCGEIPQTQWAICSLKNHHYPLCLDCDIALNAAVLEFMGLPNRSRIMAAYRHKMRSEHYCASPQ